MVDSKDRIRTFARILFMGAGGVLVSLVISAGGLETTGPLLRTLSAMFAR